MALATVCPHCNTTFRVASDQLKLRGGIVRCGACHEVFDGNAALIDPAAIALPQAGAPEPEPIPAPVLSSASAPPEHSDEAPVEETPEPSASAAFDAEVAAIEAKHAEIAEEPVYTLDFDTTFDPFGILPEPESAPEAEPELAAEPASAPEPEVDEAIVALPLPGDEDDEHEPPAEEPQLPEAAELHPPLLMRASAAAEPAPSELPAAASKSARRNAAKRKKAAPKPVVPAVAPEPLELEPEPEPESDEPEFVRRSRLREQTGRTRRIVMGAGSALLLLALAAQGMTTFRNVLAARYPQLKPVLVASCAVFGCKVELPAQIDTLTVETGELQSLGANRFSYTTLLRNPGQLAQAWPHVELALTDANDKPLVRRVFAPADYLPPGAAAAKGFAARSEQPVKLFFQLDQIKASGYHIAIFYP